MSEDITTLQSRVDKLYAENQELKKQLDNEKARADQLDANNKNLLELVSQLKTDKKLLDYELDSMRKKMPAAEKVNKFVDLFRVNPKKH
jgi:predicted nuclease with TOPRIM domain